MTYRLTLVSCRIYRWRDNGDEKMRKGEKTASEARKSGRCLPQRTMNCPCQRRKKKRERRIDATKPIGLSLPFYPLYHISFSKPIFFTLLHSVSTHFQFLVISFLISASSMEFCSNSTIYHGFDVTKISAARHQSRRNLMTQAGNLSGLGLGRILPSPQRLSSSYRELKI